ncbi:hypothetical protein FOZ62_024410, partial [Perkinsus olseni]
MADPAPVVLYSFYRSSCAYRVRIALALKAILCTMKIVNIDKGEQKSDEYLKVNPSGLVPSLVTPDGEVLTQSLAILDYLEVAYPQSTRLWPQDPVLRVRAVTIAIIIIADTQPLQNLSCINYASELVGRDVTQDWSTHFIQRGLAAVEELLSSDDKYCVGNDITVADVCLVPQVYNAINRIGMDVEKMFPKVYRIYTELRRHPAFVAAAPESQPDWPSAEEAVRIALQYKGLQYESIAVDLVKKEHLTAEYGKINPAMMVPSLVTPEGRVITQSIAIIDYLDSTYPETPRLIPEKGVGRTAALSIALTIACDTHPLQNLSVFQYASEVAGRDVRDQWVTHFIERGLSSVEELVQGGGYCVGQRLSIADVCLVPQVYNALRFQ